MKELKHIGDIFFYDWPLVSVYRDQDGQLYIIWWCDLVEEQDVYHAFKTTRELLLAYFDQHITYLELIEEAVGGRYYDCEKFNVLDSFKTFEQIGDYLPGESCVFQLEFTSQEEIEGITEDLNQS